MSRIRSSEKPIRHSGNRDNIGRRGGIQKIYLGKDVIDYHHLTSRVREDVAQALTQAEVVRAQKEVWDRARFISELGKITVEQLEGLLGFDNLDDIVKDAINTANDAIESTILKLNSDPRSETQFSSIKQTAQEIDSVVFKLSGNPDDPQQFSAIKQTAEAIDSVVATLNKNPDDPSQFSSIKQTSQDIENIVATLNSDPEDAGQFSSIRQTASQISQVVSKLNSDPKAADQYSAIRQTAEEIDLRVRKDQVISSINLSPEEIRISGNRVSIDADTLIARKVILAENLDIGRIPSSLPEGGTLFHFDHSLLSTRGLRPLSGYVATLRPGEGRFGGAVAVEEATQNLIALNKNNYAMSGLLNFKLLTPTGFEADLDASTDVWHYVRWDLSLPVGTYTIHFEIEPQLSQGRFWLCVGKATEGNYPQAYVPSSILIDSSSINRQRKQFTFQVADGSAATRIVFYKTNYAGGHVKVEKLQLEAKPFPTSFVDGTRAAGKLFYPPNLINTQEFTFAAWWKPIVEVDATWGRFFQVMPESGSTPYIALHRFLGEKRIGLVVPTADGTGVLSVIFANTDYDPNEWQFVACRKSGRDVYIRLNDQVAKTTLSFIPADFQPGRFSIGSTPSQANWLNGLLDEVLILPYAASDEEIEAWYQLGAPFYDAAEITVGGRGAVVINEEGAFGYSSNGVKRAGFSTDGKWVAGGRADGTFAVEADEAGLRVTAPGGEVRFNTDTNGNVFVAGELRPSILILPVRES